MIETQVLNYNSIKKRKARLEPFLFRLNYAFSKLIFPVLNLNIFRFI